MKKFPLGPKIVKHLSHNDEINDYVQKGKKKTKLITSQNK